jgi:hypothetical protein
MTPRVLPTRLCPIGTEVQHKPAFEPTVSFRSVPRHSAVSLQRSSTPGVEQDRRQGALLPGGRVWAPNETKGSICMRHKRTGVLLALLAVLAMSAVVTSAASAAAPEFKPATKQAFTGTSGALTIQNALGSTVTCSKQVSTGEITSATTVGGVVLTLTGCESPEQGGCKFNSEGAKNLGEIVTNALKGVLGTVKTSEAASGVGLLLEPASGSVWAKIEGTCITDWTLKGNLAAEVTPIKTLSKTGKLVFAGKDGSQAIRDIVVNGKTEKPGLLLLGGPEWDSISWGTTETLTFKSNALEVT